MTASTFGFITASMVKGTVGGGGGNIGVEGLLAASKPHQLPLAIKRILINLSAPVGVGLVVVLLWLLVGLLRKACKRPFKYQAHYPSWRSTLPVASIMCLFFFYPWLVRIGLGFFSCIPLDSMGDESSSDPYPQYAVANARWGYWSADMQQACYTGWHMRWAMGLGVPAVLLFCVGVPVGIAVLLYRNRRKIDGSAPPSKLAFLYNTYRPERYYYEVVSTVHIACVMAVSVFSLTLGPYYSLLLLNALFVLWCAMEHMFKPYAFQELQTMSLCSMGALYFTTLNALTWFSSGTTTPSLYREIMGVAGLLVNAAFILACCLAMGARTACVRRLWSKLQSVVKGGCSVNGSKEHKGGPVEPA